MTRLCHVGSIALMSLGALALCTAVWAQPGPGGPPPGGPGFGMFGGGPGGMSLAGMYGFLLNTPTVQKELELVDDQKAKIKEAGDKAQAAMREMFSGMRDLSNEERQEKMREVGKKMQAQGEQTRKSIEEALLPHQLERLRGIALQMAGVGALNDKQLQQDLKLSEDQVAKIKSIGEESGKKMQEMFAGMRDLSPEDRQAKMAEVGKKAQEMRKDSEKQLLEVLTDDQKASIEKMKGEKLVIPPSEFRGPGGPRRPGGPGAPKKAD